MIKKSFIVISLIFIFSCNRRERIKKSFEKEREEFSKTFTSPNGDILSVTYIPSGLASNSSTADRQKSMEFQIQVKQINSEQSTNNNIQLLYQTDSLFSLIYLNDTIWPLYVLPVANGLKYTREYIAAFPLLTEHKKDDEILFFSNWLSDRNVQMEPLRFKLEKINKLEN